MNGKTFFYYLQFQAGGFYFFILDSRPRQLQIDPHEVMKMGLVRIDKHRCIF